jgi:hypothetical protein
MKSTKKIAEQFKRHKKVTDGRLGKQTANTKKCQSFYAGDFMSYEDKINITDVKGSKSRALVKFNKVKPYVNAVKGFMVQNRRRPKYEARVQNDKMQELFSGYANAINSYCRDNADADQVETQQDGDLLTCGYGAVETALTYGEGYATSEADGEIMMGRLDPLALGWDPHAKQTNLLDSRWVYYSKEYELEEAQALFSNTDADDFEEADGSTEQENYEYFPYGGDYDKIAPLEWTNQDENLVKIYFYQWYEIEPYYKVANPLYQIDDPFALQAADAYLQGLSEKAEDGDFDPQGEILTFTGKIKKELVEYFGDLMDEVFEFNRKVYYTAVISGESVFTAYRSVSQQGFTIQFKTGDFDASNNIWTGMVNSMMEPVLYYNKSLTELMYTIAANSKGGVFYEESAINDIASFERDYAKTDAAIEVAEGALQKGQIREKARAHLPTGLEQIVGMSDSALSDVNGFDVTFMGSREFSNDTATFQRQRVKQAVSLLACYFDAAALYQKRQARVMLDLMRVFVENNQNMAIRVIGEEGNAMFIQLQSNQISAEYDVTIGEAPLTTQGKQEQAEILIGMGDKVAMTDPKAQKEFYSLAVELMPIDLAMKERMKETLTPDQPQIDPAQVQQMMETIKQLQDEGRQASLAKTMASAQLDVAKAQESSARVSDLEAAATKKTAETTETLENARNKSLENEIITSNSYDKATVTI